MPRILLATLIALPLLAGCGKKTVVERTSTTEITRDAEEESSVGTSVSFTDDTPEERMRAAGRAETAGDFKTAIGIYGDLYENEANSPEIREKALYRQALAYADAMNTRRDFTKATERLTLLLEEFQETEHREDAEAYLEQYRKFLSRD
jgi:hypothetical protein